MNRLDATFAQLRERGELGLFPYLTTGFPDPASCVQLLETIAESGADGIELGVPFSDPLADGATLQQAGAQALEHGASIEMALDLVRILRARSQIPVTLMSYYNPVLAFGIERLACDGAAAGLDGLIVPDLPLEEVAPLQAAFKATGLHVVLLLAPTSTAERVARTAQLASGFVYCVALTGVTGAREKLAENIQDFVGRVRQSCGQPLVVGFGISRPEHVAAMRGVADGVIVASALADLIESTPPATRRQTVQQYLLSLREAAGADLASAAS